jgi:hypothetical protein
MDQYLWQNLYIETIEKITFVKVSVYKINIDQQILVIVTNLVCASHLNWMKYIHNQLVCCSFETSMSIQYLSLIVSCRNDKETNQVIDQMARPARGYKRRRGTVKTNSHKMWPTSWGVVGIVYVCCCAGFSTRVYNCGGGFGLHQGYIILASPCVPMVLVVLTSFKIRTSESFLGNGVTERSWTEVHNF